MSEFGLGIEFRASVTERYATTLTPEALDGHRGVPG